MISFRKRYTKLQLSQQKTYQWVGLLCNFAGSNNHNLSMKLSRYPYTTNDKFVEFEFKSYGPNGIIRKMARFLPIGPNLFAFGFGDYDNSTGDVNDTVVSNNKDAPIVLATLAQIIHDFTDVNTGASIFFRGSTPARTRLYQMGINAYWDEISASYNVLGSIDGDWESFAKGRNYEALMGNRKPGK